MRLPVAFGVKVTSTVQLFPLSIDLFTQSWSRSKLPAG